MKHLWKISIDDGFCEHEYAVPVPDSYSIQKLAEEIGKKLRTKAVHLRLKRGGLNPNRKWRLADGSPAMDIERK